jgi:Inner membrane protein CreD
MKRLLAIGFIWLGCAMAWMVLASTVIFRGGESSGALKHEVRLLWGPPMVQPPPEAMLAVEAPPVPPTPPTPPSQGADAEPTAEAASRDASPDPAVGPVPPSSEPAPSDARPAQAPPTTRPAALMSSDIEVALVLEQRKKGLLWFPTYAIDFAAGYAFAAPKDQGGDVTMRFPLAGDSVVYDAFSVTDEAGEPVDANIVDGHAVWSHVFEAGQSRKYRVRYKSRGTASWGYGAPAGPAAKIRDFRLAMTINTPSVDFPAGTMSPSEHAADGGSWRGEWRFDSLVSSAPIGVELPQLLNPGPLVSKVTFFAPVSLLFFFFVTAILAAARRKELHPMHFFLVGCGFFAFHLLFAYSVDHLAVLPAFGMSAAVSMALVISYARLFVGWRFALLEMGGAQLVYLVLFSYTFFWQGFTGLAVTIGAILTLFVIMQITGRLDWGEAFASLRKDRDEHPPAQPPARPPPQAPGKAPA